MNAVGCLEVWGLVAAIEAADAMLKAANVRVIARHRTEPARFTLVVEGDLAACRAAVDAGVAAASRLSTVFGRLELGRPDEEIALLWQKDQPTSPAAILTSSGSDGALSSVNEAQHAAQSVKTDALSNDVADAINEKQTQHHQANALDANHKQAVLKFIASHKRGKTLREVTGRFTAFDEITLKAQLDQWLSQGIVVLQQRRFVVISSHHNQEERE